MKRSAINDRVNRSARAWEVALELDAEHGALLSDRRFGEFVRTNIASYVREVYALETLGSHLVRHPSYRPAGNVLINFKGSATIETQESNQAKGAIAAFNVRQVSGGRSMKEAIPESLAFVRIKNQIAPSASVAVLESIAVLDRAAVTPQDAVLGARAAVKAGITEKAIQFSIFGLKKSKTDHASTETINALSDIFVSQTTASPNSPWSQSPGAARQWIEGLGRDGFTKPDQGDLLFRHRSTEPAGQGTTDLLLRPDKGGVEIPGRSK